MADFTLIDFAPEQLVAMADGLLAAGRMRTAADLYRAALKHPGQLYSVRARLGLAQTPVPYTSNMVGIHRELMELDPKHAFVSSGLATWLKILPFFEDPRFYEIADSHRDLLPIPNWHWNLQTVLWAVRQARDVPGDFVELGVFRGHTTLFCAEYVEFQGWDKTWFLYDTFEGIPEDQLDPGWDQRNADTYANAFSYEEVAQRFSHIPNIKVIQGRVPEILAEESPGTIAFLHVDLNNSTAEIQALDALFDRVSPGGIIVFDDFCWATARAQHEAEKRWFAERGLHVLPLPTGQGVFVKR